MKTKNCSSTLLKALTVCAFVLTTSLLVTGCGSSKKASEVSGGSKSDVTETQAPEYQLSDDCALIHIYRKSSMAGAAISYDVYLDDEKVYRASNKSKTTIRLTKAGPATLSAKTETKTELPINIELGKEYYVNCGIKMGALVGRPKMEIVDKSKGKPEFDKVPLKKKK